MSSTTRGVLGTLVGLGLSPWGAMPTTRLGGARSFRAPMLPFSNAPLGPEGDLDHLFAVGDRWGTTLAKLGGVNKGACGNGIRWPIPGSRGQLYRSVSGAFCGPV